MSYCIYIGKNLSADGRAYLAGYGDEPSSHCLELVSRQQHASDATITVGVTATAEMSGVLSTIPQVTETARHIRVSYSYYRGVPAPLTNGGLNEHGVAVRDVWSSSRSELCEMTPHDQHGLNYSDLARIVLERATSAREGVDLIGDLIAQHGYATYGGNSHFIADATEGWVVIEFAGGMGLWIAQRVGADEIRVSRPGYIEEIDVAELRVDSAETTLNSNLLASPNFIDFASEQGWYTPDSGEPFNVNQIYGDGRGRWEGVRWMEEEMWRRANRPEQVGLADLMWAIRTPQLTGDTAGYGQVVPLYNPPHNEQRHVWHTASGAVAAPFAPVFIGNETIPPEFRQHRYLTHGESARFMDLRKGLATLSTVPQQIEAARSAFRAVKRLMYYLFAQHETMLPEVTQLFEGFERRLIDEIAGVEKSAEILLNASETALARQGLTYFSTNELLNGLRLVETITAYLESRHRLQGETVTDDSPISPSQIW